MTIKELLTEPTQENLSKYLIELNDKMQELQEKEAGYIIEKSQFDLEKEKKIAEKMNDSQKTTKTKAETETLIELEEKKENIKEKEAKITVLKNEIETMKMNYYHVKNMVENWEKMDKEINFNS